MSECGVQTLLEFQQLGTLPTALGSLFQGPTTDHSLVEEPFPNSFTRSRDGRWERKPSHRQAYWMLMDGLPANSSHGGCGVDNELGAWTFSVTPVTILMRALAQWHHSRPAVLEADPLPLGLHLEVKGLWWHST